MHEGLENFGGEELLMSVSTGIQPMWAVYTVISLVLLCIVITVWYSDNGRGKR